MNITIYESWDITISGLFTKGYLLMSSCSTGSHIYVPLLYKSMIWLWSCFTETRRK